MLSDCSTEWEYESSLSLMGGLCFLTDVFLISSFSVVIFLD